VERVRERDNRLVLERLGPLAISVHREAQSALDSAVHLAFLVERRRVDEFSRAVGTLRRELEGRIELRYVGPLPPYSFTGDRAVEGRGAWA
jgi:hypothetical protein